VRALLIALAICVFWNGIVSLFLSDVIRGWQKGRPDWFLTIFLIPFELIGLGLLIAVLYNFLRLFNPRVKLIVSSSAVPLGAAIEVAWVLFGRSGRVRRLRIWLEGREEARYRRGTSTYTDRKTFAEVEVAVLEDPAEMAAGKARLEVPADSMHTFKADNNKILWVLRAQGDIAFWPDVSEEFELTVMPLAAEGGPET